MERRKLTEEEIRSALPELEGWDFFQNRIHRKYEFANFTEALAFVNRVGEIAEAADHHPDITFGWGYADISITTHDRGGVTDIDLAVAKQITDLEK